MSTQIKKTLSTALKIGISFLLLWLVYSKVSFVSIWETIKNIDTFYFFLALLLYGFSQILSSQRLLRCFHTMDFLLSAKSNRLLYLMGMFYNFFVPGGIGGDAYKVYLLNKQFKWKLKSLGAAVLADRASGLVAICCWIVVLLIGVKALYIYYSLVWLPLLLIVGIFIGNFIFSKIFPSLKSLYFKLLLYSFFIQGLQMGAVFFILLSLQQTTDFIAYFILFFISSLLSIFSFSGIGVREFIFLRFSPLFNFIPQIAVSVGVIFTIVSFFISLPGIFPILLDKNQMHLKKSKF